ncbi:MAG TPA: CARDB domain-containing protein [Solirubrobacteraceae bacterium]|nr:CARDB domain-containing protein [Solirubrobacteraceae bacterium]
MACFRRLIAPLLAGTIVLAALLTPAAFGAGARAAATGPTGTTGSVGSTGLVATLSACHIDPLTANRYAIFASQMTEVAGTRTMAVSFLLQERSGKAAGFVAVSAPGFGEWVSSQPNVGIFTYDHEVTGLPAPAAFRVLVHARWIDRHHRVIRHQMIVSPVCVQPLLTPDLSIGLPLTRAAGPTAATVLYSVVVRNDGTAAAGPFQVSLSVGGVALAPVALPSLAADSTQLVQFSGPRCSAGSSIVATADAGSAVSEPANVNRTRSFACR